MTLTTALSFHTMLLPENDTVAKNDISISSAIAPNQPRNTFTVSYANRAPGSWVAPLPPSRDDVLFQQEQVRAHRQALHEAFIAKHEQAIASVSEADRQIGVKMLLRLAAQRDLSLAEKQAYPPAVLSFMKTTWQQFLRQGEAFLKECPVPAASESDIEGATPAVSAATRSTAAVENISSIGVWFSGPNVSLPLRQYAVQVPNINSDGEEEVQTLVVVGLLSFAYSSYVMQLRSIAQQSVLAELKMIEEQLGTKCLFAPKLLITP